MASAPTITSRAEVLLMMFHFILQVLMVCVMSHSLVQPKKKENFGSHLAQESENIID